MRDDDRQVFYFADQIPDADAVVIPRARGPYASDSARVYWMGKPIDGADPNTFRVLNAAFECTADAARAYYRNSVVAEAERSTFPPGRAVSHCDETSPTFAE